MRDELIRRLGRFDSIVEAHQSGDVLALLAATEKNIAVHQGIVEEAQRTIERYEENLNLLIALANDAHNEIQRCMELN